MAKTTKRERKFRASGGVKKRLEKGTITKKGKLRKRKKGPTPSAGERESKKLHAGGDAAEQPRNRPENFVGDSNLADLDMEHFFATFADDSVDRDESDRKRASDDDSEQGGASSSSESDMSEDEDVEATEAHMRAELGKMSSADPEFHEFLQENEQSLLEFGKQPESDNDDGGAPEGAAQAKVSEGDTLVTIKLLKSLSKGTFDSHSIKSLKKLVRAYKAGCHLADAASQNETRPGESGKNYVIESSKVYDQLMLLCLNRCHEAFRYHLLGAGSLEDAELDAPINPKTMEKADVWSEMKPILLSFFRSTGHVLGEAKEPELITLILKSLAKSLPLLSPLPTAAESVLRSMIALWSAPLDSSEDYQVVRLNAFLRIRQLALTQPFPCIEECLKKTYLACAKRAKFGSAASVSSALPTLTFMGNCLVELYSLDYHSSYQHAFVYIRQLALLLRSALQKKTSESIQQVYCWQFLHSLKLWTAVLSAAAPTEEGALMRSLVYPLTEIILGTARLSPSQRFLPLRFQCVRLLQQLAASCEVFIPTTFILLDCLDWKEWYVQPKKSKSAGSVRAVSMQLLFKFPSSDGFLRTHEQLESSANELFVLLQREIELYRYSAGFPEFVSQIVRRLRQFCKDVRSARSKAFARGCIDSCKRYSEFAVQARSKLQEAPKDVTRLECLLPSSEPTMRERHEASMAKENAKADAAAGRPTSTNKTSPPTKEKESSQVSERSKTTKTRKQRNDVDATKRSASDIMEQEDMVQEGIDWSSDDDDDDDDDE